ncbi:MAG: hypothetical protein ACLR7Z_12505 [Bilophila wadsworthia]
MALRGAVGAAIIGFANLKEAWALLTAAFSANPYLLAIGAAVTLAVVVMDNWGAVKAFLLGVWDAVASAFDNAVNFVTGAGSAIAGAVAGRLLRNGLRRRGCFRHGGSACLGVRRRGGRGVRPVLGHGRGDRDCLAGIMDGFRLLGGLAAAIFSGDLSGALDAGIGLFRNFGKRPSASSRRSGRHPRRPVLPVGQGHGGVPGLRRVGVWRCGSRGFGLLRCG